MAKLQSKGLKVLCDIVINHRCAQKQDKNGIWNVFGGKMAWDAEAIVVNDRKFKGRGNRATGDEFAAAPNIDHMQDYVRKDLTDWMEWLRDDIGFDGWRCVPHRSLGSIMAHTLQLCLPRLKHGIQPELQPVLSAKQHNLAMRPCREGLHCTAASSSDVSQLGAYG